MQYFECQRGRLQNMQAEYNVINLQDILQNTTWMNFAQLDKKVHFKCKDHNTTHPLSFIILLTRLFRDIDLVCTQFLILLARILKTKTPTS